MKAIIWLLVLSITLHFIANIFSDGFQDILHIAGNVVLLVVIIESLYHIFIK